jgi:hypothetical protein
MEENTYINKQFELDCNENGYGVCIRCRINAGPMCDTCFIIIRKMDDLKYTSPKVEVMHE